MLVGWLDPFRLKESILIVKGKLQCHSILLVRKLSDGVIPIYSIRNTLGIAKSLWKSVDRKIYSFIYLFIYLFVSLFIYLFMCLFVCLFIHLFIFIILRYTTVRNKSGEVRLDLPHTCQRQRSYQANYQWASHASHVSTIFNRCLKIGYCYID